MDMVEYNSGFLLLENEGGKGRKRRKIHRLSGGISFNIINE